jgi:hypothetical protein
MPGSARPCGRIRRLLLVACLLFAPPLDALDGGAGDGQLGVAPTTVASPEKRLPLARVPGDPPPCVLGRPLERPLVLTPPTRRSPITPPTRSRPSLRVRASAGAPDADPA